MLVSIIIPVFNGEKYLTECLESVVKQTYLEKEVIIVDDGSTDRTREICKEYSRQYDFVKAVHKNNGGVSSARNVGLSFARGEALMFVDADDWLDSMCVEVLVSEMNNFDMVMCDFGCKRVSIREKCILSKKEAQMQVISDKGFRGYVFAKLFRTQIIQDNHLLFDENISYCEDELFMLQYLHFTRKSIIYVPQTRYHYRNNSVGAMSNRYRRDNLYENQIESEIRAITEGKKWIEPELYPKMELRKIKASVATLRTMVAKELTNTEYFRKLLSYVRRNFLFYMFGKSVGARSKLSFILECINPKLEYGIWLKTRGVS